AAACIGTAASGICRLGWLLCCSACGSSKLSHRCLKPCLCCGHFLLCCLVVFKHAQRLCQCTVECSNRFLRSTFRIQLICICDQRLKSILARFQPEFAHRLQKRLPCLVDLILLCKFFCQNSLACFQRIFKCLLPVIQIFAQIQSLRIIDNLLEVCHI